MSISTKTAQEIWNSARRDLPRNARATLYTNEAWGLIDRAVKAVHQTILPVYQSRYRQESVLTQSGDEIDLSAVPMMFAGYERSLELETTMENVQRLYALQLANYQSGTFPLVTGDNWVPLKSPMPDSTNWSFDVLRTSSGSYAVLAQERTRFKINASENCTLTWAAGRNGTFTTEVFTTVGASLNTINISEEYNVVSGDNTIGWSADLLSGYTVKNIIITSGSFSYSIDSYGASSLVLNCTGAGTVHIEIEGQAIVDGVLLAALTEIRAKTTLTLGANTITFSSALADYIFATIFNFNLSGSISYTISNVTSAGFDINTDEATTLMYRVRQKGMSLAGVGSTQLRTGKRVDFQHEYNVWNTGAKQNQCSFVFRLLGDTEHDQKLQIKKGYGLSTWQSFTVRYIATPQAITSGASLIDIPEGFPMELLILVLRQMIVSRYRDESPGIVEWGKGVPEAINATMKEIYGTAYTQGLSDSLQKKAA